jgi:hypothetical protein
LHFADSEPTPLSTHTRALSRPRGEEKFTIFLPDVGILFGSGLISLPREKSRIVLDANLMSHNSPFRVPAFKEDRIVFWSFVRPRRCDVTEIDPGTRGTTRGESDF